jgi:hypothetical protein
MRDDASRQRVDCDCGFALKLGLPHAAERTPSLGGVVTDPTAEPFAYVLERS